MDAELTTREKLGVVVGAGLFGVVVGVFGVLAPWPVLLAIGGGAVAVRRYGRR